MQMGWARVARRHVEQVDASGQPRPDGSDRGILTQRKFAMCHPELELRFVSKTKDCELPGAEYIESTRVARRHVGQVDARGQPRPDGKDRGLLSLRKFANRYPKWNCDF